jgi:hypothetical protein
MGKEMCGEFIGLLENGKNIVIGYFNSYILQLLLMINKN